MFTFEHINQLFWEEKNLPKKQSIGWNGLMKPVFIQQSVFLNFIRRSQVKISQWVLNFGAQTLVWPPVSSPHPHFMLLLLAESHGGRLGNPSGSALDQDGWLAGEYCAYVIQRQAFLERLLWVLDRVLLMVQWWKSSPQFLPSWNL